jgi:serine/threonine protein kinase
MEANYTIQSTHDKSKIPLRPDSSISSSISDRNLNNLLNNNDKHTLNDKFRKRSSMILTSTSTSISISTSTSTSTPASTSKSSRIPVHISSFNLNSYLSNLNLSITPTNNSQHKRLIDNDSINQKNSMKSEVKNQENANLSGSKMDRMLLNHSKIPRSSSTISLSHSDRILKHRSMINFENFDSNCNNHNHTHNHNHNHNHNHTHNHTHSNSNEINNTQRQNNQQLSSNLKFNYYTSKQLPLQIKSLNKIDSISNIKNEPNGLKRSISKRSIKSNNLISRSSTFRSSLNIQNASKNKIKNMNQLIDYLNNNTFTKTKFQHNSINFDIDNDNVNNNQNNENENEKIPYLLFDQLSSKRPDLFEKLTMYERIMQYPQIYFTGKSKEFKIKADLKDNKNNHNFDDKNGNFKIIIGDHIKYKYEIKSILGKGAFGSVISVIDHSFYSKPILACKIIKNDPKLALQAVEEIKLLKKLNHSNILKYIEHFNFRSHMCIITEILGVSLYEAIQITNFQGFSLNIVKKITKDILNGISYIHSQDIIHCDLKPENIMISNDGNIKIIDFGSSCYTNKLKYSYLQSRFYRAPEVLLGGRYDTKMDIWSIGLIALELFAGIPLFQPQNEFELFYQCIEYLNIPSRKLILQLRDEILNYGIVGMENLHYNNNSNNNNNNNNNIDNNKIYNTLLWKAFDNKGGINYDYINTKLSKMKANLNPGHSSVKHFLRKNTDIGLSQGAERADQLGHFENFVNICLVWNKKHRASATACLESVFFSKCDD